jgi:hypothetical protein
MTMQGLKIVPGGDVAAISVSGTTYSSVIGESNEKILASLRAPSP